MKKHVGNLENACLKCKGIKYVKITREYNSTDRRKPRSILPKKMKMTFQFPGSYLCSLNNMS
jgi:hypothetical protein